MEISNKTGLNNRKTSKDLCVIPSCGYPLKISRRNLKEVFIACKVTFLHTPYVTIYITRFFEFILYTVIISITLAYARKI